MFKNLMAALVATFVVCLAATAMAKWESDMTEDEGTCADCESSIKAFAVCTKYVNQYCPADTAFSATATTAPKPNTSASAQPPPPPVPPVSKQPAPPPTPPKEWTCKGFGHKPETAKTSDGCACVDSDNKPSATHSPVVGATNHTVWCVLSTQAPDVKQAADWIAELNDPALFNPSTATTRAAKLKRVKDLLLKIDMMQQGAAPTAAGSATDALVALRGQIAALEDRFEALLQGQCGIEDPKDPKWTVGAIQLQCRAHVKELARGETIKIVPRAHVTAAIAFAGGPTGPQVGGEISVLHEFGTYRRARLVSGLTVGGTFNAPKTGGQMYFWPQIGSRVYLGDPFSRNTFSLDVLLGGKQLVSAYGHNPTFEGIRYNDSQFWGTFATIACEINIAVSSWLHVGFGGWVGYGWKINTYPSSPRPSRTLAAENGVGGGGRMFVSFDF